jgi:hypothetical protein
VLRYGRGEEGDAGGRVVEGARNDSALEGGRRAEGHACRREEVKGKRKRLFSSFFSVVPLRARTFSSSASSPLLASCCLSLCTTLLDPASTPPSPLFLLPFTPSLLNLDRRLQSSMHRFFDSGFLPLHTSIVSFIVENGVHGLLPLLSVNKNFRRIAVERLLESYRGAKVTIGARGRDADGYGCNAVKVNKAYVLVRLFPSLARL